MNDDANGPPLTSTLKHLEDSRQFLQRLIRAASSIEGLKHSLEHMLAQGELGAEEEPYMAQLIDGLGRKVRNLSDAEVKLSLEKLDRKLRGLFEKLVPLVEQLETSQNVAEETSLESAVDDIAALKRVAQTSLALRGLLSRRGVAVPEFRLPLDRESLRQRLQAVARQEQAARRAVVQQVRVMGRELRQLLEHAELPDAMRTLLQQLLTGLRDNLEHLKAGRSVSDLPLAIEDVSFLDLPEAKEPLPLAPEGSEIVADDGHDGAGANTVVEAQGELAGTPPSLWRALRLWISSPWHVSWGDIRSGRYRG